MNRRTASGLDLVATFLMGVNRDPGLNCVACGRSVYHHSRQQEMECSQALHARPDQNSHGEAGEGETAA